VQIAGRIFPPRTGKNKNVCFPGRFRYTAPGSLGRMKPYALILASASPRRVELLRQITPDFEVVPSAASEIHNEQLTAWEMAQVNAYRKARAVAKQFPDAVVIGADTLVYLDRDAKLFGKPATRAEAERMLGELQGQIHAVITGVCLLQLRQHRQCVFAEWTDVRFHALTPAQIRDYLDLMNPLDKAGGYAIQEHGERLVAEISGSYSNVVGLPLERLREALHQWEIAPD
jgi:septum formation protein